MQIVANNKILLSYSFTDFTKIYYDSTMREH